MITKTIKLNLDRTQIPPAALIAALVFILAGGISAVGRYTAVQRVAQPTPALVILLATPIPLPTAEPIQVAAMLPRFVVAYDQPVNGSVLGPIPVPDASAIVARYGSEWVLVPWDGGNVWLRAADVGLPNVADLAPTEAPIVVYVAAQPAPAPAYAAPTYQVASDPPSDWYSDIPTPNPAVVRELIGSDPNALACNGSPLCGGLTNAEAQEALR